MTFNTGKPVPSTDPRDLYDNAENFDKLVNGADPFYADRLGKLRLSWAGMENDFDTSEEGRENAFTLSQADKESRFQAFLVSSGYVSKGDYAANVVLAERNEYVAVDAATSGTSAGLYRPNASATVPLTLTGTWATDAASLVLLGDDALRQEIVSGALLTASMVSGVSRNITDVAALRATAGRFDGEPVNLLAYGAGYSNGGGGGLLYWDAASTTADDGGITFAVTGVLTGRWVRRVERFVDAAWYGLPLSYGFCYSQVEAIERFARENGRNIYFGPGVYDVGDANWPFRNPEVPPSSLRDYGGMVIAASGPATIFKTTSAAGADVLQLNAVKGLSIVGFPTVTATLTAFDGAGSNGVSFTFGGEDLIIDVNCRDLPFVDKGNYGDGGKAYTLQTGEGNSLGYSNIKIRGYAKGVLYGFGVDADYDNLALYPISGVTVDLFIEDAYRAYVIGLAAPTVAPARLPVCGISGRIAAKNCQQYLVDSRGVGGSITFEVMSDKEKADLIVLQSDPQVLVSDIKSTKHSSYQIRGSVKSVDKVLSIGAVPMGGGVIGRTDNCQLVHDVSYTAATTPCEVINFGGNSIDQCDISLFGIPAGYTPILSEGANSLKVNGVALFPTVYAGDETIAAVRSPNFVAVYASPLTSVRSVLLPSGAIAGDKIRVSRLSSSTGSTLAIGSVKNLAAGQWADLVYSGTDWVVIGSGSV